VIGACLASRLGTLLLVNGTVERGFDVDRFIGRYSKPLAVALADAAGVEPDMRALDVGCGPGALTVKPARRLGPGSVSAVDPSDTFVEACAQRNPGVEVRVWAS